MKKDPPDKYRELREAATGLHERLDGIEDTEDIPSDLIGNSDPDEVMDFIYLIQDSIAAIIECLNDWQQGRTDSSTFIELVESSVEEIQDWKDDVHEKFKRIFLKQVKSLIDIATKAVEQIKADPARDSHVDRGFYVYSHIDPKSKEVFYVGKGKGKRAWSKTRPNYWKEHVEKLGGVYEVIILEEHLTELESEKKEILYMLKYKQTILNLQTYNAVSLSAILDDDMNLVISTDLE